MSALNERLNDLELRKQQASKEVTYEMNKFQTYWKYIFKSKDEVRKDLENKIRPKYFEENKYLDLKHKLDATEYEIKLLRENEHEGLVIIACENKNAEFFNKIGYTKFKFIEKGNSSDVFFHIQQFPNHFGIRDRDFLTDREVQALKKAFPNYFILDYYCYENYLYHPENIAELILPNYDLKEYQKDIIAKKNSQRDYILSVFKNSRDSYQDLKWLKLKSQNVSNYQEIIDNLRSDEIEIFFKSFSMKECSKEFLSKYRLTEKILASTSWFKNQLSNIFISVSDSENYI